MSYGIIAPLVHGVTVVVDEGEYDARRWYRILAEQRVRVSYTAPTALRMLMRTTPRQGSHDLPASYDLSRLRFIASVGEPLNPEAVVWGQEVLGLPVHDNWWRTETGCIMIANFAPCEIRPGSSWGCAPAGRRCPVAICTTSSGTRPRSPTAGTSPAIWSAGTRTAGSGSWAVLTTSSSRRAI
jgi:acyl-coenzyme A synthetase/AMP-(fatty) acid ligase